WEATVQGLSTGGLGLLVSRRFERGTILTIGLADELPALEIRVTRVERAVGDSWFHGCVFAQPLGKEELGQLILAQGRHGRPCRLAVLRPWQPPGSGGSGR